MELIHGSGPEKEEKNGGALPVHLVDRKDMKKVIGPVLWESFQKFYYLRILLVVTAKPRNMAEIV